jgi:hypothetical protein
MATTSWFLPTSITVENNLINAPDTTWSNINYLTTLTGTKTQSASMLCYNANTNYIIATGFNAETPLGTEFVGAEFEIQVSLHSVSDTNNVKSNITIARYNGSDFETNNPITDWGYENTNLRYYAASTTDITQAIAESSTFGIKLDAMNDFSADCYTSYIDSIKLRIHYNIVNPRLYYNGDNTSEVFVTLDLNPEVTNPTTTFQILDGYDLETYGYTCGAYYTGPVAPDPSGAGFSDTFSNIDAGTYVSNYLSTPVYNHAGTSGSYILSDHVMSYNTTNLVVGNTYRRGLILLDIIDKDGDEIIDAEIFDILYFNIEVIDTTPILDTNPYFLYNGDTTSEINITLYQNDTSSVTNFKVVHEVPDSDYPFVDFYSIFKEGLLIDIINDTTSVGTIGSFSTVSFYSDVYTTPNILYGSDTTSDYSFTYNTTGKSPGEYRFRLQIGVNYYVNYNDYFDSPQEPILAIADSLYFNITVIEEPAPSIVRRRNTGTYSNFMI